MLKALLLTGYFLSVPTVMLAPAVFAGRPASSPRAVSHLPVASDDAMIATDAMVLPAPQRSRLKGGTNM